jgi:excisionase family DNA binding protein
MLIDLEPVPYSIEEFARAIGSDSRTVRQKIADGKLKTVPVGMDQRIPFTELRRTMEETVQQAHDLRQGLALALHAGFIKEVGLDERGSVVYERTDTPM